MKTQPKLLRVISPPPVSPGNLLAGPNLSSITTKAMAIHLSKVVPTAIPRTHPHKMHLITVHPSQPFLSYLLVPEGPDKKSMLKSIVVHHVATRQILWIMSLGDIAAALFDIDPLSKSAGPKQQKALKDLGRVLRLDFADPSTLYWTGFHGGTASGVSPHETTTVRWSYLLIQFTNRILIVNLRRQSAVVAKSPASSQQPHIVVKPLLGHVTQEALGSMISSNAIPISQHVLVVGTTDGTLKVFDWKANKVLMSSKPLLGSKSDCIVHLCSTNKYSSSPDQGAGTSKRRIAALTKKGSAYLMDLDINGKTITDISAGAKFEGGAVPTSMSKVDDDHSSMEHIFLQYDAYRDLLLWMNPSKFKAKLIVWDLSHIAEQDAKQKKKGEPQRQDPNLVLQFPYENITTTIFPGWNHECVPHDSMTCLAVTKDGDLQMLVAPLHNAASSMKNPYNAVTIMSVNLSEVLQRDLQLPEILLMKVQSLSCPPLRDTSIFYIATTVGILLVRMADGNVVPFPGYRHTHLSANHGSLGKSVLSVRHSEISYGSLESKETGLVGSTNPLGTMEPKAPIIVYESPPPMHLPPEIHKRPVRLPPSFLASPSRNFLCCYWKEEMRYEILHIATLLQKVTSRTESGVSPLVASGTGVASFAWVGDDDVFCLLYNPEQDLALKVGIDLSAPTASLGKELASAARNVTDLAKLKELSKLKELASLNTLTSGAQAVVGTASKLKSLEGLREIANTAQKATVGSVKGVTKVGMGTVKLTGKMAVGTVKGTTKLAVGTVKQTGKVAVGTVKQTGKVAVGTVMVGVGGANKMVGGTTKMTTKVVGGVANVATFGLLNRKKAQQEQAAQSSLATADDDDDEGPRAIAPSLDAPDAIAEEEEFKLVSEQLERKHPWCELRAMVAKSSASEMGGKASSTASNLGELKLRSGKRNPPTVLFGGPVLCVGSKVDEHDEGLAYFYTRKKGQDDTRAAFYVSSGPAFPCPDLVSWDDDGRLVAVVIQDRVAIYLSDEPDFVILGTVRLGSSSDSDVQVVSVRFIHGVLFCTTRSCVQCVFLGDLEGGICHLDTFTLASSDVPKSPSKYLVAEYISLTPPTLPMPLNHPHVMGFQNGSLIISTVSGLQAIPLSHPLLRIGILIAAGQKERAEKWFDAVPECDHEALATFLERRGAPELALQLSGLSLETTVDFCMKYGFTDRLEEVVELFGLKGLRAIDMGRGVSSNIFGPEENGTSVVVCVGAYLLSQGKVELVRRLATESLGSGDEGKKEAFVLASLLLSVDGNDAKRVLQRAVEDVDQSSDWIVGSFVRQHILDTRND